MDEENANFRPFQPPSSSDSESDIISNAGTELDYESGTISTDSELDSNFSFDSEDNAYTSDTSTITGSESKADSEFTSYTPPQSFPNSVTTFRQDIAQLACNNPELFENEKVFDVVIDTDNLPKYEDYIMAFAPPSPLQALPPTPQQPEQVCEIVSNNRSLTEMKSVGEVQQQPESSPISDQLLLQFIRGVAEDNISYSSELEAENIPVPPPVQSLDPALDSAPTVEQLMEDPTIGSQGEITLSAEDIASLSSSFIHSPVSMTFDDIDVNLVTRASFVPTPPTASPCSETAKVPLKSLNLKIPSSPSSLVSNKSIGSLMSECAATSNSGTKGSSSALSDLEGSSGNSSRGSYNSDILSQVIVLSDQEDSGDVNELDLVDLENDNEFINLPLYDEIEFESLQKNETNASLALNTYKSNSDVTTNPEDDQLGHSIADNSDSHPEAKRRRLLSPSQKSSCITTYLQRSSQGHGCKKMDYLDKYVRNKSTSRKRKSGPRPSSGKGFGVFTPRPKSQPRSRTTPKTNSKLSSNSESSHTLHNLTSDNGDVSAQNDPNRNSARVLRKPRSRGKSAHSGKTDIDKVPNEDAKKKVDKSKKSEQQKRKTSNKIISKLPVPRGPTPPLIFNERIINEPENTSLVGYYIREYEDCIPPPSILEDDSDDEDEENGEPEPPAPFVLSLIELPKNSIKKKNTFFHFRVGFPACSIEMRRKLHLHKFLAKPPTLPKGLIRPLSSPSSSPTLSHPLVAAAEEVLDVASSGTSVLSPTSPLLASTFPSSPSVLSTSPPSSTLLSSTTPSNLSDTVAVPALLPATDSNLYVPSPPFFRIVTERNFISQRSIDLNFKLNSNSSA